MTVVIVTGRNLLTDPRWGSTQMSGFYGDLSGQDWLNRQAMLQPPGIQKCDDDDGDDSSSVQC